MKAKVVKLYKAQDLRIGSETVATPDSGEVLVRLAYGGICGSDLHYFHHGGFGDIRVVEPIILGHEASAIVEQSGADVIDLSVGDTVAINPSSPCHNCSFCDAGLQQHCANMKFMGSAMLRPHVQGAFRQHMILPAHRCVKVSTTTPNSFAAVAEPLAVCLHAANRVTRDSCLDNTQVNNNGLKGKRVIITGAGPIGCLCAAVARLRGATDIVVTDLESFTLGIAQRMGASRVINVRKSADTLAAHEEDKGYFDICFECSGAQTAVAQAIRVLRPQGTMVQVGNAGELAIPFNRLVSREINLIGSFRFHKEFTEAVKLIDAGTIDIAPLISDSIPFESAVDAFHLASDRSKSVKVLLEF